MKSKLLVFTQFFIIFLMVIPFGEPVVFKFFGLGIIAFGALIGSFALYKNRLGNFNIRPDIKVDGKLITTGIYSYIRHPMYSSVLVTMGGVVVLYPMEYEYVLYALLVVTLLIKLHYEESLWKCESLEYQEYCKSSKKIIPMIY